MFKPMEERVATPDVPDLSRPSLQALSYLLRHRELWPRGFKWDYASRSRCADGLGERMWGTKPNYWVRRNLWIFDNVFAYLLGRRTPTGVANAIDRYLTKHEA